MDTTKLTAADVMTRSVFAFAEATTVREAASALIERRFSGAPVVDGSGKLTGVLTEQDLIGVFFEQGCDLDRQPIGTCEVYGCPLVTRDVVSVHPETEFPEVAKKLVGLKVKRIPVVDCDRRVVGIVSRRDILRTLLGLGRAAPAGA